MTRARALLLMWAVIGAIVWLGVYDYISTRGHKEYLYRSAELRLGIQPPPGKSADLREVMAVEGRHALIQATGWAVFIVAAGWTTVWVLRK
ncbi:MAG TPA: hypothetical protein VMN81_02410 [Vicinamibacterales bacterium]|nr:hypothetical protein [Vicinamibacterales bacterium]